MEFLNNALDSVFGSGPIVSDTTSLKIGDSLIIAPHPDDESLACGGTISLLTKNSFSIHVIFTTDGTMSHPNSKIYTSEKRRVLREEEGIKALGILGVQPDAVHFLRLPDARMDRLSDDTFQENSEILQKYILRFQPTTIFIPWRDDPHPDHKASWDLSIDAIKRSYGIDIQSRVLEYPVWFWERTDISELLPDKTVSLWQVKIEKELAVKKKAIFAHASQLGEIIQDDPKGFFLSTQMVNHFLQPVELFFEYKTFSR